LIFPSQVVCNLYDETSAQTAVKPAASGSSQSDEE